MPEEMAGLIAHFKLIGRQFADVMRMKNDPDADVYPSPQGALMNNFRTRLAIVALVLASLLDLSSNGTHAASPLKKDFVTRAAIFSGETKQPKTLDPQVFVRESMAPEATGPQGIKHVAGVRPPLIDRESGTSELFSTEGRLRTSLLAAGPRAGSARRAATAFCDDQKSRHSA